MKKIHNCKEASSYNLYVSIADSFLKTCFSGFAQEFFFPKALVVTNAEIQYYSSSRINAIWLNHHKYI